MASMSETPTFNLKAVIQITDLKPDTLRAWERRYGLPQPVRTGGGHRLYSQHDIDTLKWLISRQEEGMSISRAVALWRKMEADGQDPIREYSPPGEEPPIYQLVEVGSTLLQLREAWIENCLEYEEQKAEQVLAQAFSLYPPETVCVEVLQKGLAAIGQQWYEAEVTVQQEHFASALALRKIEALIAALPAPSRAGRLIVGCPPHEEHTFSPLLLTFLLRRRGWEVIFLGANVPLDRMDHTLAHNRPRLVVLSAQTLPTAATLLEMATLLFEAGVPLAYGGLVFNLIPSLTDRIPGHFLGKELVDAPAVVEKLMSAPRVVSSRRSVEDRYLASLQEYREKQALIESGLMGRLNGLGLDQVTLLQINYNMAQYMGAALALGDLDLLEHNLAWLRGMVSFRQMEESRWMLNQYLRAYTVAAREAMGKESDNLLFAWLESVTAERTASFAGR